MWVASSVKVKMFPSVMVVTIKGLLSMSCSMLWDFGTSKVDLTVTSILLSSGKISKEVSHDHDRSSS